jgi:hypothetical protein
MKVNGLKIKHMGKGYITIMMGLCIRELGKKINKMGLEKKFGQTQLVIKGNIKMVKNAGKAILNGQMDLYILENFKIIIFKERVYIYGTTYVDMKEIGKITKWMDLVNLYGLI